MNPSVLKTSGPLAATLATLLFMPAHTRAVTIIDHVPYTITAPGKYELQADLTYDGDIDAITVNAADVVIDLNGYTLRHRPPKDVRGVMILAHNVTVQNGTISGFEYGVVMESSQDKAESLQLLEVLVTGVFADVGADDVILNCYIIGRGANTQSFGILIGSNASGSQVSNNQISECAVGVSSDSATGSAFIHNYVANSSIGLSLGSNDYYQGNVATNCTTAFTGGHAIGTENGGD